MHFLSIDLGMYTPPSHLCWTQEDNKAFELALAQHFRDSDRWSKIATQLPGKTAEECQRAYEQLEEDLKRIDDNMVSTTYGGSSSSDSFKKIKLEPAAYAATACGSGATSAQDRRKGVPWTQDEHRLFLLGLAKFGKGSWRSIARQYVVTRTPTQVASHAQKYFLRLTSIKDKKDKRRASIHDMTTDHLVAPDGFGSVARPPAAAGRHARPVKAN